MYAAIDAVVDKVARQMRKYKTRLMKKHRPRTELVHHLEEHVLQTEDHPAQLFAFSRLAVVIDFIGDRRQHGQVDSRRKVSAVAADNRHPRLGRGIDPVECAAQFFPNFAAHRICLAGPVEAYAGDVIFEGEFQRGQIGGIDAHVNLSHGDVAAFYVVVPCFRNN